MTSGITPSAEQIAATFAESWGSRMPQAYNVELPFRLRPESDDVHHIFTDQEYFVVRDTEPYSPAELWQSRLGEFTLQLASRQADVHVYSVPEGLITLPALMNDATSGNGDPTTVINSFRQIGSMLRTIAEQSQNIEPVAEPGLHLSDIAFLRGRLSPIVIPPFAACSAGCMTAINGFAHEIEQASHSPTERQIVQASASALRESYRGEY